jgi:hypothetical protein
MNGCRGGYRYVAKVAQVLVMAALLAWLPSAAWARMEAPPPPLEQEDPELGAIVRDIILLRMINEIGLTRDQIAALIPELEGLLRDEQATRADVKALFLEQRRALLKGNVPEAQLEASRARIKQRTDQFRDQSGRRLDGLTPRLSAEQVRQVRRLVTAGPALWRHGPRATPPASPREPQLRRGPDRDRGPERPSGEEMAPSGQVLERVIALLKEKLQAMPK